MRSLMALVLVSALCLQPSLVAQVDPKDPICYEHEMLRRQARPPAYGTVMAVAGLPVMAAGYYAALTSQDGEGRWNAGQLVAGLGTAFLGAYLWKKGRREHNRYNRWKRRQRSRVIGCDRPYREDRWTPVELDQLRRDYEDLERMRKEAMDR